MNEFPLLTLLILLPVAGALIALTSAFGVFAAVSGLLG